MEPHAVPAAIDAILKRHAVKGGGITEMALANGARIEATGGPAGVVELTDTEGRIVERLGGRGGLLEVPAGFRWGDFDAAVQRAEVSSGAAADVVINGISVSNGGVAVGGKVFGGKSKTKSRRETAVSGNSITTNGAGGLDITAGDLSVQGDADDLKLQIGDDRLTVRIRKTGDAYEIQVGGRKPHRVNNREQPGPRRAEPGETGVPVATAEQPDSAFDRIRKFLKGVGQ